MFSQIKVQSISRIVALVSLNYLLTACLYGANKQYFGIHYTPGKVVPGSDKPDSDKPGADNSSQPLSPAPVSPVSIAVATPSPSALPTATPQDSGTTTVSIRKIKPSLAVRGASCLACHANIQSNMVTDFGFGDSYFLDKGDVSDGYQINYGSPYFNHGLIAWQSARIFGSLIIPKVTVSRANFPGQMNTVDPMGLKSEMSLSDLIQSKQLAYMDGMPALNSSIASGVTPLNGEAPVIEKSSIYIGAPTQSEILSLAPTLIASPTGFAMLKVTKANLSGLEMVDEGHGSFVRNKSNVPFVCMGDVVIKGTLFLNNLNLVTDDNGCRIYASQSIFVQGAVKYNGGIGTGSQNLQLSSARAILMGFDQYKLSDRLSLTGISSLLPYASTRGPGTNKEKRTLIYNESLLISELEDAGSQMIPYSRMLLNAPEVHSRYTGEFSGVVVGEIVLFRLGKFSFKYDTAFDSTPILPSLEKPIFSFTE